MTLRDDDTPEPATGGWAARYGLIRPRERRIAGVCGAFGRATGTDPLLWQVVLAVLIVFAGAGLALYVAGWLLFPSEGDETSATEALFTSKKSSMSVVTTLLMGAGAILLGCIALIATDGSPFLMLAGLIAVTVWLARRREGAPPPTPAAPVVPVATPAPGYQAPFAPGGPYARADATAEFAVPLSATRQLNAEAPPPAPPQPAARPRPEPRRRSALGLVFGCLVVIELSVAATIGMLGGPITLGSALAVAVVLCGIGLLAGAWWGRARGLILLGGLLTLALAAATVFSVNGLTRPFRAETVTITGNDVIPSRVSAIYGSSEVDLAGASFADRGTERISVNDWHGEVTIEVPENVDIAVDLEQQRADVVVDSHWMSSRRWRGTVSTGDDGPGGGKLIVSGTVESGQLRVER